MITVERALETIDLALAGASGSRATIHVTRLRQIRELFATADDVRDKLAKACKAAGVRSWARAADIDPGYVSRVLSGKKQPADGKLLDALGLECVVFYRQKR